VRSSINKVTNEEVGAIVDVPTRMGGSTKTLEELEKVTALAVEVTKDFHRGAHLHQRLLREEQVCDFAAHTLQLPSRH
jgi:hypothetical protein